MIIKARNQASLGFCSLQAGQTNTMQCEQTQKLASLEDNTNFFRSVTYMQLSEHHAIGSEHNETPQAGRYSMLSIL